MRPGLDVNTYFELPLHLRDQVDAWMKENDLLDKGINHFIIGDGLIEAVCYQRPFHLDDTHRVAMELKVFPVKSPPPVVTRMYPDA